MNPTFASERTTRLMSLSLGVADLALLASNIGGAIAQSARLGPLYTLVVVLLVTACAVAGLVGFRWAPLGVLRRIWSVQSLGMVVATVALLAITAGRPLPDAYGLTWVSELAVLGGCAAVLGWQGRITWVLVVGLEAALFAVALVAGPYGWAGRAFGDAARQLFFVTFFTAVAAALVRAGRTLDAAAASAAAEAGAFAEADAKRAVRRRTEMLVHDTVLVALLAYATNPDRPDTASQAAAAVRALEEPPVVEGELGAVEPREFAWQLQSLTTSFDATIGFSYEAHPAEAVSEAEVGVRAATATVPAAAAAPAAATATAAIPAEVALRITEAVSEAVRNSLRHAGPAASRQVHASVAPDAISVVVLDDGPGFDPERIPATRLGVRRGIVERMRSLPGGSAEIRTTRGYGTAVLIGWRRP